MNMWKMILIFFTFRWLFESSKNSIGSSNGGSLCNDHNHNGICDGEEQGSFSALDFDEPDEQVWSSMTWLDDYDDWGSSCSDDDED